MQRQIERRFVTRFDGDFGSYGRVGDFFDRRIVVERFSVRVGVASHAGLTRNLLQTGGSCRGKILHHRLGRIVAAGPVTCLATDPFVNRIRIRRAAGRTMVGRRVALQALQAGLGISRNASLLGDLLARGVLSTA